MRQLTEAQAWREIARRIAEGQWYERGLCKEVDELYDKDAIEYLTWNAMRRRISDHMDANEVWSLYLDVVGYPDVRVLAALFLSYEASEE